MRLEHGKLVSGKALLVHNHPPGATEAATIQSSPRLDNDEVVSTHESTQHKSLSTAEMLRILCPLLDAHLAVITSNGTDFFEKELARYVEFLSRILPPGMFSHDCN